MVTDKSLLNGLPAGARITVELPDGRKETYVKATKSQILKRDYAGLIGIPITVTDATGKYDIPRSTIIDWVNKGYIAVLQPGYQMSLNEAEVAYCVGIYHSRKREGIGFRAPLLDGEGLPYELKHPQLSVYRKRRKQAA